MPENRALVTIMQAADIASVSRRTIYNWLRDGRLEYIRTAGGAVRIYHDTLFKKPKRGLYATRTSHTSSSPDSIDLGKVYFRPATNASGSD